jgi:hypothetical protein
MENKKSLTIKILVTSIVIVFVFSLLLWQYSHGGVITHHILHRRDLPGISNWWGGLLLPVLTWLLLGKIEKRLKKQVSLNIVTKNNAFKIIALFFAGFVFGILIAISFTNDYQVFLDNVIYIFLLLSFFVPVFYGEFIIGFVLAMTYTFGAIIPTFFILIIAIIGFLIYQFIRPFFIKATRLFAGKST